MKYSRLLYQIDQRVCTITMHHVESNNAADETMARELSHAFVSASKDAAVKAVVLTGTGSVFCAGEGEHHYRKIHAYDFGQNVEDAKMFMRMAQIIYSLRKPVVAKVNGHALGAGCLLAAVCDFAVASRQAEFGFPEAHSGLIPALAVPFLVKKIGEGRARELMLSGAAITAAEAKAFGLITASADRKDLDAETANITSSLISKSSGSSLGLLKEMFATIDGMKFAESMDYAANMHAAARMTDDGRKGIAALIDQENLLW